MRSILTILFTFFAITLFAQHIQFPLDTNTVTIDGNITTTEWQGAETILINVNTAETISVMFKHDNSAMYFAFSGKLESANSLFPEVLIDPQNKGGNNWTNGQWWFHVSATDCEDSTGYGIYNNCMTVQPGWSGAPNFTPGPPDTDSVEIRIPFGKVGFNPATMDTAGMVMMVTNTATAYHLYPNSADKDIPQTWAKATFGKFFTNVSEIEEDRVPAVYPNPAKDFLYVKVQDDNVDIVITDLLGSVLYSVKGSNITSVPVSQLPSGLYIVNIIDEYSKYTKLFTTQ